MSICRALWLDLKGTTAALTQEPEVLCERLSLFYSFCENVVTTFDTQLGQYRSFNFSDTYTLLVYSSERDVPSRSLVEVADYLIERCGSRGMIVRAFITNGIEVEDSMNGLRSTPTRAGGEPLHQVLFGVNTAVLVAGLAESAHLPGTLFVDEQTARMLKERKPKDEFFVGQKGRAFRHKQGTFFDLRSGMPEAVDEPGHLFYAIR